MSLLPLLPTSPSSPHPTLWVTTDHSAKLPVLYSRFPVAICFTKGGYVCQHFSPSSSHPPLLPLCLHDHSLHLSLYSCPAYRFICTFFLYSIYHALIWYLFFWLHPIWQKSLAFLYTNNNERLEREIKETIPFTTATERIKYLGLNLPREREDLKRQKTVRRWWKKSNTTQTDGEIQHVIALEESILWK